MVILLSILIVIDLNTDSLYKLKQLPLSEPEIQAIYLYRLKHGYFRSFYELTKILPIESVNKIRYLVKLTPPPYRRETSDYYEYLQERLTREEGPRAGAVEEWLWYLGHPLNINRAAVKDIAMFDGVSLVDAASIVRYRQLYGKISYQRALRDIPGLSYWGYRNLRNFVTFEDKPLHGTEGYLKISWRTIYYIRGDILGDLYGRPTYLKYREEDLIAAGWTKDEIVHLISRLYREKEDYLREGTYRGWDWRLRMGITPHVYLGIRKFNKGYIELRSIGPLRKMYIGTYRVTWGQGILLDNSDEIRARLHTRPEGLFGDLTYYEHFYLQGVAAELTFNRIHPTILWSYAPRNAILNPDSSVNHLIHIYPVLPAFRHNVKERMIGVNLTVDMGGLYNLPVGTYVGVSLLDLLYSRPFNPNPKYLDIPWDKEVIDDPNYLLSSRGQYRSFVGTHLSTVVNNMSLEFDYAKQQHAGHAYIMKLHLQYEILYGILVLRHYDVDYDNPYSRGFAERRRFGEGIWQRSYRLIDPLYVYISEYPVPRAEEGIYLEFRYQPSHRLIISRFYIDVWKDLAYGLPNWRTQVTLQYRPAFPLRIYLRQKLQAKSHKRLATTTISHLWETSLTIEYRLSNYNNLRAELRYARVSFPSLPRYETANTITGGFLALTYRYNLSPHMSILGGYAIWQTQGLSQWIFEDTGIDFLEGRGWKYYLVLSDRLSHNLLFRLKFRYKLSEFPHTGMLGAHSEDGIPIYEFIDTRREFGGNLLLIIWW